MRGYALFGPRSEAPGSLGPDTFSTAAEPICLATLEQVNALPKAPETTDPSERATVIDEANVLLGAMVIEAREHTPGADPDRSMVTEWIDDREVLIADRQTFADAIRKDPRARYLETEKGGNHLSEAITRFAEINEMPSCIDPGDVGWP